MKTIMKKMMVLCILVVIFLCGAYSAAAEESAYPDIPWEYIGGENGLGEIIYAQGKYITAGYDGIKYSRDLQNWETVVTVSEDQYIHGGWPAIAYSGAVFVVTGLSGGIYYSYDGIAWEFYERPFDFDISEIIWDGKQFVAVGQYGRYDGYQEGVNPAGIITSPDGINWTKLDVFFEGFSGLNHIAYNGEVYVTDPLVEMYYSYDLLHWEKANISYAYNEGIEWVHDRFIATRGWNNIMYSFDGINWDVIDQSWGNTMWACAYNGYIYMAVGSDGTIYVSYDGFEWICKTEWHRIDNGLYDIIWTGERFVLLGNNNNLSWVPDDVIKVKVNEEYLIMDAAPVNVNDRVLLPVRAIAESLSCDVSWDGDTSTATITKGETKIEIVAGEMQAKVNGEVVALDTNAIIHKDRLMLPARFVSETLEFDVSWDGVTQTVMIAA